LNQIIEIELDMFLKVKAVEPAKCQEQPEAFRAMRGMTHSVLSRETLASYLEDLRRAGAEGRNLLSEKYARIDNIIPPLKDSPLIAGIVQIEQEWMRELSEKYPHIVNVGPGFMVYLSSELETYSDETLELYFKDISAADKEGQNLAEARYTTLFKQLGYDSIDDAENKVKAQQSA